MRRENWSTQHSSCGRIGGRPILVYGCSEDPVSTDREQGAARHIPYQALQPQDLSDCRTCLHERLWNFSCPVAQRCAQQENVRLFLCG